MRLVLVGSVNLKVVVLGRNANCAPAAWEEATVPYIPRTRVVRL